MRKIVAEIPVRLGSKRVLRKNLRLLNGKPMVAYAIEACKASKYLSDIYVNSEGETIKKLCKEYDVHFFERDEELLDDDAVQDQFNYDFLKKIETDCLVMINPVSPLILPEDIDKAIEYYLANDLDSLITIKESRLQSFYKNSPLNFSIEGLLPKTQDIDPVQICAWTICIWDREKFIEHYEEYGYAVFVGKYGLFPIDPIRSLKISTEDDFRMAELYLTAAKHDSCKVEYYE